MDDLFFLILDAVAKLERTAQLDRRLAGRLIAAAYGSTYDPDDAYICGEKVGKFMQRGFLPVFHDLDDGGSKLAEAIRQEIKVRGLDVSPVTECALFVGRLEATDAKS